MSVGRRAGAAAWAVALVGALTCAGCAGTRGAAGASALDRLDRFFSERGGRRLTDNARHFDRLHPEGGYVVRSARRGREYATVRRDSDPFLVRADLDGDGAVDAAALGVVGGRVLLAACVAAPPPRPGCLAVDLRPVAPFADTSWDGRPHRHGAYDLMTISPRHSPYVPPPVSRLGVMVRVRGESAFKVYTWEGDSLATPHVVQF